MDQAHEIALSRVSPDLAAAILSGMESLDASGRTGPKDLERIAATGQCFAATAQDSQAVYILHVQNGVAWVSACKGAGPLDWTICLLPIIEAQAKGCAAVGFQTSRAGLVRKAKKQGYNVTGWILTKTLQ